MNEVLKIKLKIIAIYKQLILHKEMSTTEIKKLYIEYLKLCVCLGTNNPIFIEDFDKYEGVNCYCYALGLSLPKLFIDRYLYASPDYISHSIGFISQSKYTKSADERISNLYKDLTALNIKFYETDIHSENKHGGYKIALYNSPYDFHFIRQNSNGMWSEKQGYSRRFIEMKEPRAVGKSYELIKTLEIVKPTIK